jgi:hypothetical protein
MRTPFFSVGFVLALLSTASAIVPWSRRRLAQREAAESPPAVPPGVRQRFLQGTLVIC